MGLLSFSPGFNRVMPAVKLEFLNRFNGFLIAAFALEDIKPLKRFEENPIAPSHPVETG
jgi:hypothetical protein